MSLTCPVGKAACHWLQEVVSLRMQVAKLGELVSRDPLTGLFNFRHFESSLSGLLEGAVRRHQPLSLIMLDLDHFKRINDTWGHEAGNQTLQQVAQQMNSQVRKLDMVCRYGGEEFAIVLPETPLRQAVEVAERIRLGIETTPIRTDQGNLQVSASLGVEVFLPHSPLSMTRLIEAADQWLYQAKQNGRNQVAHRDFAELPEDRGISSEERAALAELFNDTNSQDD